MVQVRHTAEDQVNGARQEAQRAIRDLQTAASRLQVPPCGPYDTFILNTSYKLSEAGVQLPSACVQHVLMALERAAAQAQDRRVQ